jgi:S1-C subfamily serine protease
LHLVGNFSALRDYSAVLFDERGGYVETIPFERISSEDVWTAIAPGSTASLEITGPGRVNQIVKIDEVRTEGQLGSVDIVVGGVPTFENSSEMPEAVVSAANRDATARLIVGQNALPLGERMPARAFDWCTGFLVSPNLLMTVSHCIKARPELCRQTVALFGFDAGFPHGVRARYCDELVYLNPFIDVLVMRLNRVDESSPVAKLATRAPLAGDKLVVVQHPFGAVQLVSRDAACSVASPRTALRPSREGLDYSLLEALGFTHKCDTLEGSSGSPVFDGEGDVIGLHQGGSGEANNAVRSEVILACNAIDTATDQVTVLQPGVEVCANTL